MKAYTRGATKLVSAHSEGKPSHETKRLRCKIFLKTNQDSHIVHIGVPNSQALRMQCPAMHLHVRKLS